MDIESQNLLGFFPRNITCQLRQLSPSPGKCQLSSGYLARALVERKISDVGDRGTPDYRREWKESLRSKSIDILRI
jgi:hypothetical protein